jgi:ABC-type uncharacterized transport system permease subunit
MARDKLSKSKSLSIQPQPDADEDELIWLGQRHHELRTIISRAVVVYLVLFMGLGLAMSALGVNPLIKDGLMPKALLVFVGLALLIALAGSLSDPAQGHGTDWLNLMRGLIRPSSRRNERSAR